MTMPIAGSSRKPTGCWKRRRARWPPSPASLPADAWALTIEAWEGPIICAVDADEFSLRDWQTNALSGSNLVPDGGIGAFVARRLGDGLDIRLHTPATKIAWGGPRAAYASRRRAGHWQARACIVTVSTGVLPADAIRVRPAAAGSHAERIACFADGPRG